MKRTKLAYLALFTAVAGVPMFASPVLAQLRVDTSGRALDANNQIGSGGYNAAPQGDKNAQFQDAIASGNVTAGFGFRGRTRDGVDLGSGLADPFAFRGLLPGQGIDQFIANSTGTPTHSDPNGASRGNNVPQVYYGAANHSSAPAGFQELPNGQGYVPAQPTLRSPSDTRLGYLDFGFSPVLPKPNELLLPGPVDPTADGTTGPTQEIAASPLYGVMPWQISPALSQSVQQLAPPGQSILSPSSPLQQGAGLQSFQTPQQARLMQLREDLDKSTGTEFEPVNSSANSSPNPSANPPSAGISPSAYGQPLPSGDNGPASISANNLAPQSGDMSTGQSSRQYLTGIPLPPPGKQSAQYAKLQQSIQNYNASNPKTDEQANREFQAILRLRAQAAIDAEQGSKVLGSPVPDTTPNIPGIPNPEQPTDKTPPPKGIIPLQKPDKNQQPDFSSLPDLSHLAPAQGGDQAVAAPPTVPINSFATGVASSGLADLITNGENLVQDGKYDRAVAAYNDAIAVAPNNPLLLLARASAELGGGYYAQANSDLHNAVSQDPAVLIGQYDLQKHLGEKRLDSLMADLKQASEDSPDDSTHAFLYSYVLYNSHHVGKAAEWLNTADQRSKGQDPAIAQMKKYWNFNEQPTTQP